jgi:hypothetical protein
MPSSGCLVIDDVQASLSGLTELGREVAGASAEAIRNAVLDYAKRRNWFILRHQAYVEWATEIIRRREHTWLVLDPLFPVRGLGDRVRSVRLTRQFDDNQAVVVRKYVLAGRAAPTDLSDISGDVGVIDDATASGNTLRYTSRLVAQTGGRVVHILLAASSRCARESFGTAVRDVRWVEFVSGDWQIAHLRDGCPHLPHSGRPTAQPPILGVGGVTVDVRVPSSSVVGNLWQVLYLDTTIRDAVTTARSEIARQFSAVLGRAACVRDLSMLGQFVPALVKQGETVTGDVTLESLLSSRHPDGATRIAQG